MKARFDNMTRELAVRIDQPLELKPADVIQQVEKVQAIMRGAMRDGIHYGAVIPGIDKPMLLKPGAEKLCLTFRFSPSYDIRRHDYDDGHREYEIVCTLKHQLTDIVLGQGVGSASTLESKYRYRWENTGKPVPQNYWGARDPALLGGADFVPRKVEGKWWIYHRVDHGNPADYFNTVLKIGKKRALVDAVLTCTAASDVFTHEPEDDEDQGESAGNGQAGAGPQKPEGFKLS
jgi:hypothetical protein